jgi:hypothetical protein
MSNVFVPTRVADTTALLEPARVTVHPVIPLAGSIFGKTLFSMLQFKTVGVAVAIVQLIAPSFSCAPIAGAVPLKARVIVELKPRLTIKIDPTALVPALFPVHVDNSVKSVPLGYGSVKQVDALPVVRLLLSTPPPKLLIGVLTPKTMLLETLVVKED